MGSDEQAIKEWYAKKTTALKEGDPKGWIDLFPEDVIFMMPNEETVVGKEALRQWGQPYFDQFEMEEIYTLEEIEVSTNWAFARVTYKFDVIPKAGGETIQENGNDLPPINVPPS
jgi:ketosteroid isomerase-like protein